MTQRNHLISHAFPWATVTQLLHGITKTGPCSAPSMLGSPGAPCAALSAIACCQPHLLLDQRLPEQPSTKYSINCDIKRLIMTVSFSRAPLCLLHLRESMDRFSPGTSLPPLLGSCPHTHQHTLVLLYQCLLALRWQRAIP